MESISTTTSTKKVTDTKIKDIEKKENVENEVSKSFIPLPYTQSCVSLKSISATSLYELDDNGDFKPNVPHF